jgi:hypothetical protein
MRTSLFTILILGFFAGLAYGRAPTLDELPTVKHLQREADLAIEARRRAEVEAQKDPVLDLIKAYRTKAVPMFSPHWKPIADILKDDRETDDHRRAASEAFRERFKDLTGSDARIEKLKKEIGNYLLPKLNDGKTEVRVWVHGVFQRFWPGTAGKIGFKAEDENSRRRYDAYKDWRKFLKGR